MPNTNISKQIIDTIREKTHNSELLKKFIVVLYNWESGSKGAYQFKDTYKHMLKEYSHKMEAEDED